MEETKKAVEELAKKAREATDHASAQGYANAALLLTQAAQNLNE